MSTALTPSLQIKKSVVIRKVRELSVSGKLKVAVGNKVKAQDIVAEAEFPGDLLILRIPEQLGIDAADVIQGLNVKEGDSVATGQLLCIHKGLFGLFKNRFLSPYDGTIEFITERTGHLGLRLPSQKIQLDAFISGTVVEIEEGKSVTIEAHSSYVQGIFGVGGERAGILKSLDVPGDTQLKDEHIPSECSGKILFGGCNPTIEAILKASATGAAGFITGSIDDTALKSYLGYDLGIALTGNENLDMTLIITEGFGNLAFSERAYSLLKELEGQEASINGATQVRAGALRPEVIIANNLEFHETDTVRDLMELKPGTRVRIIREPYFGDIAKVTELPIEMEKIDTGAEVRVLRLELDGKIVTVPRANVEILS